MTNKPVVGSLDTPNALLERYSRVQALLDKTGPEGWSYDVYKECLQIMGQETAVSRDEWAILVITGRAGEVRSDVIRKLKAGVAITEGVKGVAGKSKTKRHFWKRSA